MACCPHGVQLEPELRRLAVILVESQKPESNAVGDGPFDLIDGDPPLGTMNDLVGNMRLAASLAVFRPRLRQKQIAGQRTVERIGRMIVAVQQVLSYDTIVDLPRLAAPLPRHAGRHAPLFGVPAGVEHADRPGASVPIHHHTLEMIAGRLVVPVQKGEKLLQGSHRRTGGQRDRFDALPLQIGRQTQHLRQ